MAGVPGQGFTPGSAAVPSSQVEISISCRNLRDRDTFSKSDPVCVLFTWDLRGGAFHELGRTEMISDSLNPDFVKKFVMNYFFEESQKLKFEIYDVDSPQARLTAHDFLGRLECTLGEIVGCGSGQLERKLVGIQGNSMIFVRTEEVSSSKEVAIMQLRATGLDKKDLFGKSDPFLIFYRANEDRSYTVTHKTEVIKNTLNPTWAPFTVPLKTLCNGDQDRTLKVECYDWDSDGSHDLIGEFTTTLREIAKAPSTHTSFQVINPKKKAKKRNYKGSGELQVMTCKIEQVPSFLDYMQGGMEMNFTVAIDFTASNGNPSQPSSLHYFNQNQQNQYAMAIQAVGEIIQDYDTDKMFPVLGFGAKLPDGSVSHEFPCTFNQNNPYCAGIDGIMQAYYTSLKQVQLYGPTNFSPVINHVSKFASAKTDGSNYFVLLIITDGVITDMPHTIHSIVAASRLPMSIIIVGVGNAEFDAMDVLDADGKRLGIEGRYAERDIVQFVPFRDFLGGRHGGNSSLSQAALAKAVLAEIPDQVVHYMKSKGVKPRPARAAPPSRPPQPAAPQGHGQAPGGPQGQGPQPGGQQWGPPPGAPQGAPGGQSAPYPGATGSQQGHPQAGAPPGYPAPPGGQAGAAPYPQGGQTGGQAPYPQGGQTAGQAPYSQGGQRAGQAPYPQGGQTAGQAPYSQGGQTAGQAPYPQGGQTAGQAPYPQGGQTAGQAPNPQGGQTAGQAPYPQGGQTAGQAPYPQGGQTAGQAPNPQGGQTAGQAPYPQGGQTAGQAPYPQGGQTAGQAPYPQGGQTAGQAPYHQGGQTAGQAPYPQRGTNTSTAPYPQCGPNTGSAPYPQGGPNTGSAPYPQGGQTAGQAPYPQGSQTAGQAPYPQSGAPTSAPYPQANPKGAR